MKNVITDITPFFLAGTYQPEEDPDVRFPAFVFALLSILTVAPIIY